MAYVVGLIATDGCLLSGRRQLNFKSVDRELVECLLGLLGRANTIHARTSPKGRVFYVTQFGDAALYDWLLRAGLTSRKSLTLGAIDVPDDYFFPLVRGLLDGDGSVISKVARADTKRRDDYYWEYLRTVFTSASKPHLEWLSAGIARIARVHGHLSGTDRHVSVVGRTPMFQLRYGKRASLALLPLLYPVGAPCLERKRRAWLDYLERHGLAASQSR